jgi:hypothetical protein
MKTIYSAVAADEDEDDKAIAVTLARLWGKLRDAQSFANELVNDIKSMKEMEEQLNKMKWKVDKLRKMYT